MNFTFEIPKLTTPQIWALSGVVYVVGYFICISIWIMLDRERNAGIRQPWSRRNMAEEGAFMLIGCMLWPVVLVAFILVGIWKMISRVFVSACENIAELTYPDRNVRDPRDA